MKLIIDIPKEVYKASQIIDVKYEDVIQIPLEVIKNGTPLDDVKAEIENATTLHMGMVGYVEAEKVIDILDNIGKAKSEDKE